MRLTESSDLRLQYRQHAVDADIRRGRSLCRRERPEATTAFRTPMGGMASTSALS
jgi:hypothetical protein